MSYTIHYTDPSQGGAHRVVPMVFRDKDTALDCACALRRAGFCVLMIEGPNFEMQHLAFEAYYSAEHERRPSQDGHAAAWSPDAC